MIDIVGASTSSSEEAAAHAIKGVKEPGDFSCHSSSLPGRSPDFPTTSKAQARGMEGSNDFRACPDSKKVQLEIVDLPRVKINEA